MKNIKRRSDCPISQILEIIGDKWTLLIVRDIAYFNKHTFNELLQSDEKIASNILSDRLNRLELAKIIFRKKHPESKAKIFYYLSKKGLDLIPVLFELAIWSGKYLEVGKDAKQFVQAIKNDRASIFGKIIKSQSEHLH